MSKRETAAILFLVAVMGLSPVKAIATDFGRIEGTVVTKKHSEPLLYANINVERTGFGAPSIMGGKYIIPRIPAGKYRIIASYVGYKSATKEVEVRAGETVIVNFELEEDLIQLEQIVVTATRNPHYIKDAPIRTEVITGRAIEDKGAVNVYEALEGFPGIRVEQQCSYCNFATVRMQGLGPNHVQVLIDGLPTFSSLASVYGLQQLAAANIEQIEVVKGAGSVLYGSSAIAGVINIITKKPTKKPNLNLTSSFGTHNTNDYTLAASNKTRNADVILTVQKNTGDEIDQDGDGFTDRVKTDNTAIGITVTRYDVFTDDEISLVGRILNESRQGGALATWENPFAEAAEHIKTSRYETGAGYKKRFSCGSEIVSNVSYARHHRNATNDGFLIDFMSTHGAVMPTVDQMQPYLADEHLFVVDLHYSHPLLVGQHLLGGAQYSHNSLEETGRYVIVDEEDRNYGVPYTSESKKRSDDVGIYFHDEISLSKKLAVVIGARHDFHRSEDYFGASGKIAVFQKTKLKYDEEAFNPRIALTFKTSSISFRASAGTGFRVPYGFSEDLHLCSGSPRVNKPSDLKPEKSISVNMGIDYTGGRCTVNTNVFRTYLKDKIDFTDAGDTSKKMGYTYEWTNVDNAYTQGIELGARTLLVRDFVLDVNLTYTDAQYGREREDWTENHPEYAADSKYIPRVPKVTGGIMFSYNPLDWKLLLDMRYTGRMYIDYYKNEDIALPGSKIKHTDPFWIINSRAAWTLSEPGFTAFVGVKNLFDYVQEERHPDDAAFMYAPYTGRIIYGGVEIVI